MKVLVIVHLFPPKDSAGTEVYTHHLAKELQRRGHEIAIYHTEKDLGRPQYEMSHRDNDGLPTICVVHNHLFRTFRDTYMDKRMEEHLQIVLDEVCPDIVHCQHLNLHSLGYLKILKDRGIPVVYTLAEYLLLCPRNGWLVRPGYELCNGPEPEACGRCTLIWPPPRGTVLPRRVQQILGKAKSKLGIGSATYTEANRVRHEEIQAQLDNVDLFIAPSRFLAERFVESGMVRKERIVYSDYGFQHEPFQGDNASARMERSDDRRLRVGYIGTVSEWKGVHVLVEACSEIDESELVCEIHGDRNAFPRYVRRLEKMKRHEGIQIMGRYPNAEIARILGRFDVLAVPSLWYENSPLTIHEAFMAGVPVITGNRGGMAELVVDGRSGLHFEIGNACDLQRAIRRLLDEPDLLPRLHAGIPKVKTITEDAAETESRFQELLCGGTTR